MLRYGNSGWGRGGLRLLLVVLLGCFLDGGRGDAGDRLSLGLRFARRSGTVVGCGLLLGTPQLGSERADRSVCRHGGRGLGADGGRLRLRGGRLLRTKPRGRGDDVDGAQPGRRGDPVGLGPLVRP